MAKIEPLIHVPDGKLGPKMLALKPGHRAFVTCLLEQGDQSNFSRAAMMAGYSASSKEALNTAGWRLAHDGRIQEAILEETQRRLAAHLPLAASVLIGALTDPKARIADKLRAVEMLTNRAGLAAITEQKITVTHAVEDEAATVLRIQALARELGLDPAALLGSKAVTPLTSIPASGVQDAEWVEVTVPTTKGLEDLL